MDKFFKKAFEFVQEDPGLLSISVDIRKMLSPLIQAQKHGAILQILDMIQSNKIDNESLFYLKALCLLREKNFEDSEISILSALLIDKNKNSGKQKENFEALYLEIKENEQFFDKLVQLYELPEEKDGVKKTGFTRTDLATTQYDFLLRQKAIKNQIPSILMLSTARSASSNIANQLCRFSGNFRVDVAAQSTPIEHDVSLGLLLDFVRGGAVSYVHSRPNEKNLKALAESNVIKLYFMCVTLGNVSYLIIIVCMHPMTGRINANIIIICRLNMNKWILQNKLIGISTMFMNIIG